MIQDSPPKLLLRFFKWFCDPNLHVYVEGDLLEIYQERLLQSSKRKADRRFLVDILMLFRPSIIRPFQGLKNSNNNIMFKNHFKISIRNLRKHKGYAFINILGLTIALAVSFIATMYIFDETSYDKFHKDSDRIYRVTKSYFNGDKTVETVPFRSYLLDRMREDIPAIESTTVISSLGDNMIVVHDDRKHTEPRVALADSNFLEFFSFKLLQGNPQLVLNNPKTVIITESKAIEYFNRESPIGEVITIKSAFHGEGLEATIVGVFEDMPPNSHFHYDFLISMSTSDLIADRTGIRGLSLKYGYLKLKPEHAIEEVSELIPIIEKKYAPDFYAEYDMHLSPQPMLDIHLHSNMEREMEANGDIMQLYMFGAIALLTLLIGSFNYINLATARAVEKSKEIGVRKTIGAYRHQLVAQLLTESVLTSFLALLAACILVSLALPYFNAISGKSLTMDLTHYTVSGMFLLISLLVGLISGIYPAIVLSRTSPLKVLKGAALTPKGSQIMRKTLIVFQFAVSSMLIVITLVIHNQWDMMRNQQYSFKPAEIINIPVSSLKIRNNFTSIKQELLRDSNIKLVTGGRKDFISELRTFNGLTIPGHEGYLNMYYTSIDADFFDMYDGKIISGRNFMDYSADSLNAIIVNESAAKLIGKTKEEILGLNIKVYDGYAPNVIGVVEDFQFQSLHGKVVPMYFQLVHSKEALDHLRVVSLKVNTVHLSETLTRIESVFKRSDEGAIFDYSFLANDIQEAYEKEKSFAEIFTLVSVIAIIIACMGIFGLTTAITNQRRKELGVRKILGASVLRIAMLINIDFIKLVAIASIVAFPFAYFAMDYWLQNFAYQVEVGISTFIIATIVSLGVAILGSGYWSMKAAISNPVDSLKTE
jgi:putative ABC transport system permease protein